LGVRPQFNLDSAAKLLSHFEHGMLVHFPCIVLQSKGGEEISIACLAQSRPFVLLAILAAASGSRTLQGHSLYDEEFRKILGLKFVAGGERSLELLMGLVVYTSWYISLHIVARLTWMMWANERKGFPSISARKANKHSITSGWPSTSSTTWN
jgi:hypothetical protein